jgi:hypothetical protein
MWVGGIKFSLASPLLQVDIGGVGKKPLWRNIYHYPISLEVAMHDATTVISLAGPLVWLPN